MVPDLPLGLALYPIADELVRLDTVGSEFASTEGALDAGLLIC